MSPEIQGICEQAEAMFASAQYAEAESLLRTELSKNPQDPELSVRLGNLLCHTQREVDAVEFLEAAQTSSKFNQFAQILVDYFHCRKLMAKKLGVKDELGEKLLKRCQQVSTLEPSDVGITLSACLIVKNEEKNLDRCLKSLQGLTDEIIVVDTGSSDCTVEIAQKYGATIGSFKWNDDFAAARNESLKLATSHWVLWIDADEEVAEGSAKMIREGLMRPHFGGYYIRIINFMREEGQSDQYVHTPIRLFRKLQGIRFTGRIHEQVLPSLNESGLITATISGARLNHYGYTPSAMEEKNKLHRTVTMLEREVAESPQEPFHWFNLANAYVTATRPANAISAAQKCIALMPGNAPYGSLTYHLLLSALIDVGRAEEALIKCDEATDRGFGGILIEFEKVRALTELKRFVEALSTMDKCLALDWPEGLNGDYGIYTHKRLVLKGQILALVERNEEALACFTQALAVDPLCALALFGKGAMESRLGRLDEALESMKACFGDPEQGPKSKRVAARILMESGRAEEAQILCEQTWESGLHHEEVLALWSAACESTGDIEKLLTAYEHRERSVGLTAEQLVNCGRALQRAGHIITASECFERAIQMNPHDPNARFNAGDALYASGRFVEAAESYQLGLQLEPNHAEGWFSLGNCLFRLELADGAKTCYEQAMQAKPNYPEAKANLELLMQTAA